MNFKNTSNAAHSDKSTISFSFISCNRNSSQDNVFLSGYEINSG